MSSRARTFDPRQFTHLFFAILLNSEQDKDFNELKLYPFCLDYFDGDRGQATDFMLRFMALIRLFDDPRSEAWLAHKENDRLHIHPAMMETAATTRTRNNGSFPDRPFFAEVQRLAESRYRHFNLSEQIDSDLESIQQALQNNP